jgi:hypothetical protein
MNEILTLPDLTLLKLNTEPTNASLWEVLARPDTKNSKDIKCQRHGPQTEHDDPTNCAQEGYLMCRSGLPAVGGPASARESLGKDVMVETDEGQRVFSALPPRTEKAHKVRNRRFEEINELWMKDHFDRLCYQGYDSVFDENGKEKKIDRGVLYSKFKASLVEWTDWCYLDKEDTPGRRASPQDKAAYLLAKGDGRVPLNRGLIFVRYFGTDEEKKAVGMPHSGIFGPSYMYITLVCASGTKGYGEKLMRMAHALAGTLGVDTVVLATLPDPNTAGFYLMKMQYKFASRHGHYIDVSEWITYNDGKGRFEPDKDVEDGQLESSVLRDAVMGRAENDNGKQLRNNKRHAEEDDEVGPPAKLPRVPWSLSGLISRLTLGYF